MHKASTYYVEKDVIKKSKLCNAVKLLHYKLIMFNFCTVKELCSLFFIVGPNKNSL